MAENDKYGTDISQADDAGQFKAAYFPSLYPGAMFILKPDNKDGLQAVGIDIPVLMQAILASGYRPSYLLQFLSRQEHETQATFRSVALVKNKSQLTGTTLQSKSLSMNDNATTTTYWYGERRAGKARPLSIAKYNAFTKIVCH